MRTWKRSTSASNYGIEEWDTEEHGKTELHGKIHMHCSVQFRLSVFFRVPFQTIRFFRSLVKIFRLNSAFGPKFRSKQTSISVASSR